jgi:Mg2+ and Co2+ transporter CorA
MPVTTSAGTGQPVSHAAARLADVNGLIDPAQPQDGERRLSAGAFVWLDLENPGDRRLRAFGESLGMNDPALQALTAVSQRPSFDVAGDSIRALVPSSNWGRDPGDILDIQVTFTERFLLTTHSEPCRALTGVQRGWDDLPHEVKAHGPSLLFFILDQLIGSFEPDLVQLDKKLDQIQLALLGGTPPGVDGELIKIRRELSEAVQALGWYVGDLHHFESARQLPGMNAADESGFNLHRSRAIQIRDAARDYRDESQDALGQVAANISSRQGQFINILTVISAVFLPLMFLTGYFGMNFGVITMDLNKVWLYVLLGILLPAAGVLVTLVILRRLIARMGIQSILPSWPTAQAEPPGHARPPA